MKNDSLKKRIIAWIYANHPYEDGILLADGLEDAFMGLGTKFNATSAVYDMDTCIETLVQEGMTDSEAFEYFSVNIQGAYVGENTPIFVTRYRP
jgi:hypothetical protein